MNVDKLIERMRDFGDDVAIIHNDHSSTYNDLLRRIDSLAKILDQRGIYGKIVAIVGDYSLETCAWLIALMLRKNIVVPFTSKSEHDREMNIAEVEKIIYLGTERFYNVSISHSSCI